MVQATIIAKLVTALDKRYQSVANKVTEWSNQTSHSKYPSEKLVKDSLDAIDTALEGKLDASDVPTSTSDLTNDGSDGEHPFITESDLSSTAVTVEQVTAETGYAATYVVKQNSAQVGSKINIPKDFLVKSGEVKTATAADLTTLGSGYAAGDKYIDFIINTTDDSVADPQHMYINVKDLVEDTTYTADGTTLTLSNGEFSITAGGVGTTELADTAVTTAKIDASAVTTAKINDGAITTAKIDASAVTTAKINDAAVTTAKINNSAVTTDKIDSEAVTTAKIADEAITLDKIDDDVSGSWLTTANVDSEIEDYLDALAEEIAPTTTP